MAALLDALCLIVLLVGWGAQAAVPWHLGHLAAAGTDPGAAGGSGPAAGGAGEPRWRAWRAWRLASLPLAVAGLVAAVALANRNPDATIAGHLMPLTASTPGRLLAVLVPAMLGASLVGSLAGRRLDRQGLRLVAAFGAAAVGAAGWAGELLRTGEGPVSPLWRLLLLAACRLALALAAGEIVAPGRPRWPAAAGAALAAYLPLLPTALRGLLWAGELQLTCAAAALLLAAARWLPPALRRPALATGIVLAAIVLAQAGRVSQTLATGIETLRPPPG
jgi:hypothetical protein